jgi:hypothetical protein
MPGRDSRGGSRFGAALLVLAAHAMLWWILRPGQPAPSVAPPEPPTISWLRLPPEPRAEPARATPEAPLRPAATGTRPVPAPVAPAGAAPPAPTTRSPEPQAITLPPAPAEPPPLILALPPRPAGSAPDRQEQMRRDPRANSRPARGATDALQALGDPGPRMEEEVLAGEGRRRNRMGRICMEVHQARMEQIDPHNKSTSPLPAQAKGCD